MADSTKYAEEHKPDANNSRSNSYDYGENHGKKFSRYVPELQHAIPVRFSKRRLDESAVENSGLLSYATFGWISGVLWKIYRKGFNSEDIYSCGRREECVRNQKRLEHLWEEEVKKVGPEKASFFRAGIRFMRTRILVSILVNFIPLLSSFLLPLYFMYRLVEFVGEVDAPLSEGLIWVGLMVAFELLRIFFHSLCLSVNGHTGLRARSAALGLLFKKILAVHTFADKSIGQVINLFASDGFRIPEMSFYVQFIINAPTTLIVIITYLYCMLGAAALSGVVVIILLFPTMIILSKYTGLNREKSLSVTDHRVRLFAEVLGNIKLLKLYAWEQPFTFNIFDCRKKEEMLIFKANLLNSMNLALSFAAPAIASIVSLVCHISTGGKLSAAKAFSVVSVYTMFTVYIFLTGVVLRMWAIGKVSFTRMQEVLNLKDVPLQENEKRPIVKKKVNISDEAVKISHATFSWAANKEKGYEDPATEGTKPFLEPTQPYSDNESNVNTLTDIDLIVKKGTLVGICGAVGSGKSSLISAILGQMHLHSGECISHGLFAYAAQQAWIMNATVRENILFGEHYEPARYKAAIRCCGLDQDIKLLVAGDKTEIGEKGANLSGGQKQRIGLARAVYSDRDVYLLDDPLSAVDAHVGKYIFNKCVVGALKRKTVIFVTHQMQYLSACDHVILLKNGRIVEQGTHEDLMNCQGEYSALISSYNTNSVSECKNVMDLNTVTDVIDNDIPIIGKVEFSARRNTDASIISHISGTELGVSGIDPNIGVLTSAETQQEGTIKFRVYVAYIKAMGGFAVASFVVFMYILYVCAIGFGNWWLSIWLDEGSGVQISNANGTNTTTFNATEFTASDMEDITLNPKLNMYMLVYSLTIILIVVIGLLRTVLFSWVTVKAASNMHRKLFRRILQAPLNFFETTPSGRILHLFSTDMDVVDGVIPPLLDDGFNCMWSLISSFFFMSLAFPWFLVFFIPMLLAFLWISHVFRTSIRELKRAENSTRSPLLTHLSTTVSGLTTIRAYGKENDFQKKFVELMDNNNDHFFYYYSASRWLFFRLEVMSACSLTVTALMVVFLRGSITAPLAGLALMYASQVSMKLQYFVRCLSDLESQFTHVERLDQYTRSVPLENPKIIQSSRPPSTWPLNGVVTFKNVHMRYRERLPFALQNVSFETKPCEKIGIVGRTGSGKSSLGGVLFRTVELTSGSILIDGLDIANFGLSDLRSKMSLIPQDPALFVGTIRFNLDPFKTFTDAEIWEALEKSYMKEKVISMEGQLLAIVEDGGQNFSVGERQLLCIARAILRKNKVLLLDEATAAVDGETDTLIQLAIKEAFMECTVLVIAHRLNTVLSSDRIIVMDGGKVSEIASPAELTSNADSLFTRLLQASGSGTND